MRIAIPMQNRGDATPARLVVRFPVCRASFSAMITLWIVCSVPLVTNPRSQHCNSPGTKVSPSPASCTTLAAFINSALDRIFSARVKFSGAKSFVKRFPQTEFFCASMPNVEANNFRPQPAYEFALCWQRKAITVTRKLIRRCSQPRLHNSYLCQFRLRRSALIRGCAF